MCVCVFYIVWQCRSPKLNETDSKFIWHTKMNHLCGVAARWLDTHTAHPPTRINVGVSVNTTSMNRCIKVSFSSAQRPPIQKLLLALVTNGSPFSAALLQLSISSNGQHPIISHLSAYIDRLINIEWEIQSEGESESSVYIMYAEFYFDALALECSAMSSPAKMVEMELNVTINIVWANGALSIICVFIHFSLLLCSQIYHGELEFIHHVCKSTNVCWRVFCSRLRRFSLLPLPHGSLCIYTPFHFTLCHLDKTIDEHTHRAHTCRWKIEAHTSKHLLFETNSGAKTSRCILAKSIFCLKRKFFESFAFFPLLSIAIVWILPLHLEQNFKCSHGWQQSSCAIWIFVVQRK